MAITKIDVEHFLILQHQMPLLDVRSSSEFQYAQIPGAFSLPLFSDEERKVIGTLYKQEGKKRAIKEGLDYFGPKMRAMVSQVEKMVETWNEKLNADVSLNENKKAPLNDIIEAPCIIIHCWRGGMRSGAVAWLLDLYGFQVYQLIGGYKAYRNWALEQLQKQYAFRILAGYTGSGKTNILHSLKGNGETVLDLEMLASHKGSAFGGIGLPPQPSQEMFENVLATALFNIGNQPCWVEDESQRIGQLHIPHTLWKTMRTKPVFFIEIPFGERLQFIIEDYGKCDPQQMQQSIERIQKRLGPLETKTAIQHLRQGELEACFTILLKYYDKYYLKGLTNRENLEGLLHKIPCCNVDSLINAEKLIACITANT
ncbi:MAG: tRNA 2-selenouridine(34) synthase MnmH [Ferruginibacter sp.]